MDGEKMNKEKNIGKSKILGEATGVIKETSKLEEEQMNLM
jgi:hypothetical protein